MTRFTPYEGSRPYLFISYSRGNSETMLDSMQYLLSRNYRLWYDEGIPPGNDWPSYIAEHLAASSAVVFYLSASSMVSPNCFSEITAAINAKLPLLCIPLDAPAERVAAAIREKRQMSEAELAEVLCILEPHSRKRSSSVRIPEPGQWVSLLSGSLFTESELTAEEISLQILSSGILNDGFIGEYGDAGFGKGRANGWLIAAAVCFCLMLGLCFGSFRMYRNQTLAAASEITEEAETPAPVPTLPIPGVSSVTFPDSKQEEILRSAIGKADGTILYSDLQEIRSICICGKTYLPSGGEITMQDGKWYANGAPTVAGEIRDLSLLGKIYSLESLKLVDQNVRNVKALSELPVLEELDLSGNPVSELDLNGAFPSLKVLNLSHTDIRDLTGLHAPESLRTVCVSPDMLPMTLDRNAAYEVVLTR